MSPLQHYSFGLLWHKPAPKVLQMPSLCGSQRSNNRTVHVHPR